MTIEDHSAITLKDAMTEVSQASDLAEFLRIGITNQSELLKWKHE